MHAYWAGTCRSGIAGSQGVCLLTLVNQASLPKWRHLSRCFMFNKERWGVFNIGLFKFSLWELPWWFSG